MGIDFGIVTYFIEHHGWAKAPKTATLYNAVHLTAIHTKFLTKQLE